MDNFLLTRAIYSDPMQEASGYWAESVANHRHMEIGTRFHLIPKYKLTPEDTYFIFVVVDTILQMLVFVFTLIFVGLCLYFALPPYKSSIVILLKLFWLDVLNFLKFCVSEVKTNPEVQNNLSVICFILFFVYSCRRYHCWFWRGFVPGMVLNSLRELVLAVEFTLFFWILVYPKLVMADIIWPLATLVVKFLDICKDYA